MKHDKSWLLVAEMPCKVNCDSQSIASHCSCDLWCTQNCTEIMMLGVMSVASSYVECNVRSRRVNTLNNIFFADFAEFSLKLVGIRPWQVLEDLAKHWHYIAFWSPSKP